MISSDWKDFLNDVTWFVKDESNAKILDYNLSEHNFKPTYEFEERFPNLADILRKARVTTVEVEKIKYYLFGWTNKIGESMGWLCLPPRETIENSLHSDHKLLLQYFGGIKEIWNEPCEGTWLSNLNSALCPDDCRPGIDGWEDYFIEMCTDEDIKVSINADEYIAFAFEANGNCTLYHKETGEVLMFAPDHCFDHITALESCPEYTLYRIEGCNSLSSWIEEVAKQWKEHIKDEQR